MFKPSKTIAAVALGVIAVAACQKQPSLDKLQGDGLVTFTVQTDPGTKGSDQTSYVNEVAVAVYLQNASGAYALYDTMPATVAAESDGIFKSATFSVNLIRNQVYKIVVWADQKGVYTYDDALTTISRSPEYLKSCSTDELDAFTASVLFQQGKGITLDGGETFSGNTITLYRPFAQLNLVTTDLNNVFKPSAVSLSYKAPSVFNALTDELSETADFEVSGTPSLAAYSGGNIIASDYIFVGATDDESSLLNVQMKATVASDVELSLSNLPLKRNYRTNVIGALLTESESFEVVVDPVWSLPEEDVQWVKVVGAAAANKALEDGATNVSISGIDNGAAIDLPESSSDISIALDSQTKGAVSISYAEEQGSGPANLNISYSGSEAELEINAPSTHVTLNGSTYDSVTATTSETTLVVEKGVTVKSLTVKKGGIEIHGTVENISIAENVMLRACEGLSPALVQSLVDDGKVFVADSYYLEPIYQTSSNTKVVSYNIIKAADGVKQTAVNEISLSTSAALVWMSEYINSGSDNKHNMKGHTVNLVADLDMSGIDFVPIWPTTTGYVYNSFCGIFDGNKHTISNLKAHSYVNGEAAAGLFGSLLGVCKNVNMKNVDIRSYHYAGGVVGFISGNTGSCHIDNCSVDGGTITAFAQLNGDEYDNGDKVGGIIGYITGKDYITGCSVSNITVQAYRDMGALVGCASFSETGIKDCTIGENVKVVVDKSHNYKYYTDNSQFNAGSIYGRKTSSAVVAADGTVGEAEVINLCCAIGETEYSSVANAFEAAQDGDVITLLDNSVINALVSVNAKVTLNLGGKTLINHSSKSDPFDVAEGASITIVKNGGVIVDDLKK